MRASSAIKNAYASDIKNVEVHITIDKYGITLNTEDIYTESIVLKESIMDSDSVDFVGCIASSFEVTCANITDKDIKGSHISVVISANNTPAISLFNGYIDSVVLQSDKFSKKITAYDTSYGWGNLNVRNWYDRLIFPISMYDFRESLFAYLDIQTKETVLPNDEIMIQKHESSDELNALDLIKSICKINGVFGIINRNEKFEFRILDMDAGSNLFPATDLYPRIDIYPGQGDESQGDPDAMRDQTVPVYRNFSYQEYKVEKITKVGIRNNTSDEGVTAGNGTNCYMITGNYFANDWDAETKQLAADNILYNVNHLSFYPFESVNIGLPYVECGDELWFTSLDGIARSFPLMSRTMTGLQSLKDTCKAVGTQYQPDIEKSESKTATGNTVDNSISQSEDNALKAVAVPNEPPTTWEHNTIYFIYEEE